MCLFKSNLQRYFSRAKKYPGLVIQSEKSPLALLLVFIMGLRVRFGSFCCVGVSVPCKAVLRLAPCCRPPSDRSLPSPWIQCGLSSCAHCARSKLSWSFSVRAELVHREGQWQSGFSMSTSELIAPPIQHNVALCGGLPQRLPNLLPPSCKHNPSRSRRSLR